MASTGGEQAGRAERLGSGINWSPQDNEISVQTLCNACASCIALVSATTTRLVSSDDMHIPVNLCLPAEPSSGSPSLPPQLVQLGSSEVALIELQGSFHVTDGDDRAAGLNVGILHIDGNNKPTLRVGAHLLEGKVVSLSKPLVLLVRDRKGDPDDPSAVPDVEYNTVAFVKKKIVFSRRPMPIPNARPPA